MLMSKLLLLSTRLQSHLSQLKAESFSWAETCSFCSILSFSCYEWKSGGQSEEMVKDLESPWAYLNLTSYFLIYSFYLYQACTLHFDMEARLTKNFQKCKENWLCAMFFQCVWKWSKKLLNCVRMLNYVRMWISYMLMMAFFLSYSCDICLRDSRFFLRKKQTKKFKQCFEKASITKNECEQKTSTR